MLESERFGHRVEPRLTLDRIQPQHPPELRERCAALVDPRSAPQALLRAAEREIVADQPERKEVRQQVRARYEHEQPRPDEPEKIDEEPKTVLVEVASELLPKDAHRCRLVQIVRVEEAAVGLPAEMPQQPLLSHALRHPSHRFRAHPCYPSSRRTLGRPMAALAFGIGNHLPEAMNEPAEEPRRGLPLLVVRVVGNLAIQLVSLGTDGHEIDLHGLGQRYLGFTLRGSGVRTPLNPLNPA